MYSAIIIDALAHRDWILETLTDGQHAELVRRLYERGGDIQKAVLDQDARSS